MKKKTKLPSNPSAVWAGGFAIESPGYVCSVAASGGTVLAGGERLYLLRQGATRWVSREPPPSIDEVVAVGVDPRRRGRMVVVGRYGIQIIDGVDVAVASSRDQRFEFVELAWGPSAGRGSDLYLLTSDETVFRLRPGVQGFDELALSSVQAITSDEKGGLVYACLDEDDWRLDVHLHVDPDLEVTHSIEAPEMMDNAHLAVRGGALAVGFPGNKVWLTRTVGKAGISPVDELSGGPVAFDGPDGKGALFGVAVDGNVTGIVRISPDGAVARIGELGAVGKEVTESQVRQLAWDATRSTLWAAVGDAGVLSSTAPGARPPSAGAS